MSLIAEFTIETPILRRALEAAPEMTLHTETIHLSDPTKALIWAWGDDFRAFEQGLEADPTVDEHGVLTDVEDRRLYRITHTERGESALTYPTFVAHDATVLHATGSREGLEIRARFPDREAFAEYREACRERDVPFRLRGLFREEQVAGDGGDSNPYGLTSAQREVLLCALERGYFDVPRGTTQDEIADELGISVQAVSTRLRRGQRTFLRNALEQ